MTGIINLYKEKGMTSHTCVAKVRKILKIKKTGHPGTLDPEATGVLPIMVGGATRCSDLFLDMKKTYRAEATFGLRSDTQDIWGNVERTGADVTALTREAVKEALSGFKGTVLQVPPAYSALKKDGVPLYKLARRGEAVEAEARPVNIYSCELLDFSISSEGLPVAAIEVCCGRGTYIRTIINDLGGALGCGAVMSKLERTSYGDFKAENAVTLGDLEEAEKNGSIDSVVRPVRELFGFPMLDLTQKEFTAYMQGKTVTAFPENIRFPESAGTTADLESAGTVEGGNRGANVPEKTRVLLLYEGREFALCEIMPCGGDTAVNGDRKRVVLKPDRYFGTD